MDCTKPGHEHAATLDGRCTGCLNEAGDLPQDYEQCAECGYDHAYEPVEANEHHLSNGAP